VKHKLAFPVLHLIAAALLCAPAASTSNERAHSFMGRIMCKKRCSMTSAMLERNTLGYAMLRKAARAIAEGEQVKELGKEGEGGLDLDEIVDSILRHHHPPSSTPSS